MSDRTLAHKKNSAQDTGEARPVRHVSVTTASLLLAAVLGAAGTSTAVTLRFAGNGSGVQTNSVDKGTYSGGEREETTQGGQGNNNAAKGGTVGDDRKDQSGGVGGAGSIKNNGALAGRDNNGAPGIGGNANVSPRSNANGGNAQARSGNTTSGATVYNNVPAPRPAPVPAVPQSKGCPTYPTTVSAPESTGVTFSITITVDCPPAPGRKYYLVVELNNIGEHQTTNYYPRGQIEGSAGNYSYDVNIEGSELQTTRKLFVISVDAQQEARLGDNGGELINALPTGTQLASLKVSSTRIQ